MKTYNPFLPIMTIAVNAEDEAPAEIFVLPTCIDLIEPYHGASRIVTRSSMMYYAVMDEEAVKADIIRKLGYDPYICVQVSEESNLDDFVNIYLLPGSVEVIEPHGNGCAVLLKNGTDLYSPLHAEEFLKLVITRQQ